MMMMISSQRYDRDNWRFLRSPLIDSLAVTAVTNRLPRSRIDNLITVSDRPRSPIDI